MSRFMDYHRRTGGCNAYCQGNRHAVPMMTLCLDKPLEKRQAAIAKEWPGIRLVDVIEAREMPNETRLGIPLSDPDVITMVPAGEYTPALYIVEVTATS